MVKYGVWACLLTVLFSPGLLAEEIIFKNGDRLTATILSDSKRDITISSSAFGTVTVDRSFIASPAFEETAEESSAETLTDKYPEWMRTFSLGYSRSGGNTIKQEANTSLYLNRKTDNDEVAFRFSTYYSSADRKMDSQKFYTMGRYVFSFGPDNRWYSFYKLEADHDRFADIDYRLIPSAGAGRWIFDAEDWKVLGEMAGGAEYTDYRSGKENTTDFVIVPRGYFKKSVVKDLWIEQDLTAYCVFDDLAQYRLRSESSLVHKMTERMSWKLSFIDDYTAEPAEAAKKNDYRLIYSIDYSF